MTKRIAIVGGGAAGCGLLWSILRTKAPESVELQLFHDEDEVGGHSRTIPVWFDEAGKGHVASRSAPAPSGAATYPVDIGVQFVCPTLYPNLYQQLREPELAGVRLTRHPALRISGSFGPEVNWGNFGPYQSGTRFDATWDETTRRLAAEFERDMQWAPFKPLDGISLSHNVEEYLRVKGVPWTSGFFRYCLLPYLSIINGYGTTDLLATTLRDLYPIFAKVPGLQDVGPYGSFTSPGLGWDRFTDGSTAWVAAMANYGLSKGAQVHVDSTVLAVYPKDERTVVVEWASSADVARHRLDPSHPVPRRSAEFDEVVLTTDMNTNRAILGDPRNPHYARQSHFISGERFVLIPGVCYIHQDDACLSPHLRDKEEDGQFVGAYAWNGDTTNNVYGLPYDLRRSFQTYLMKNILGTPVDCHVSMYESGVDAVKPAEDKIIHQRTWVHGRWVASFFEQAKRELHHVQGLGHVWFAGNNTTFDSEEGALISAMAVASELFPESFEYPFPRVSEAHLFYQHFAGTMFPKASLIERAMGKAERRLMELVGRA